MAYKEPDTALHHLKMAKSYMDNADSRLNMDSGVLKVFSEQQLELLAKAAEHLNRARAIDPTEVLLVPDEKNNERVTFTQDFMTARVLLHEGIAHINSARDMDGRYKDHKGRVVEAKYREGVGYLENARDALEKSLTFNSYGRDALRFLQMSYQNLGDEPNFRRILERRVELYPEDIGIHREIEYHDEHPGIKPMFEASSSPTFGMPFFLDFERVMFIAIGFGFFLIILAFPAKSFDLGMWGFILMLSAVFILWVEQKWNEWFG